MAIKDREEGALGPAITLLLRRLLHIQHNRHTVFVVVTDDALVGVRSVRLHHAVLLDRVLGRLEVRQLHVRQLHRLRRARVRSVKQVQLVAERRGQAC